VNRIARKGYRIPPGGILAHSTHVKGAGTFDAIRGEQPRIQVTLATGISAQRCHQVNLSYADYRQIDPDQWAGREHEGVLLAPNAGEVLYRVRDQVECVRGIFLQMMQSYTYVHFDRFVRHDAGRRLPR